MMEQKTVICLTVSCRAISSGSKSRMVGHVPPAFQLFRRFVWLLVRLVAGKGVSAGMYCEIEVLVFPIDETRRGTSVPSMDNTLRLRSKSRLPADGSTRLSLNSA